MCLLGVCSILEEDLLSKLGSIKCDPYNTFLKVYQANRGALLLLKKVCFLHFE